RGGWSCAGRTASCATPCTSAPRWPWPARRWSTAAGRSSATTRSSSPSCISSSSATRSRRWGAASAPTTPPTGRGCGAGFLRHRPLDAEVGLLDGDLLAVALLARRIVGDHGVPPEPDGDALGRAHEAGIAVVDDDVGAPARGAADLDAGGPMDALDRLEV